MSDDAGYLFFWHMGYKSYKVTRNRYTFKKYLYLPVGQAESQVHLIEAM